MDELVQKRYRLKAKLIRVEKFAMNYDRTTDNLSDISVRLELLSQIWEEFDNIQGEIERCCKKKDLEAHEREQEDFENKYLAAKSKLLSFSEQNTPVTQSIISRTASPPLQVKLPLINIPSFYGDYQQWTSFHDLFNSLVHNNTSLSPVQKLHYLKSALRGEAGKLLNSISVTDANYSEALKILKDRYGNRKQIVSTHLKALFSQPRMNAECARDLRKLLDTTIENIRGLHVLGLPTDHWDCLLVFLVIERVDSDTRRQWELTTANDDEPTFAQLKQFLETRCRALEAAGTTRVKTAGTRGATSQRPRQVGTDTVAYHTVSSNCDICEGEHPLFKCEQFMNLPVQERCDYIKSASLCFNCLRGGHQTKQCKSSMCRKCGKPHHTLLHHDNTQTLDDTVSLTTRLDSRVKLSRVLLATAIVKLQDVLGQQQVCRALLDSGSQASFISEACVQRLGLKRHNARINVCGVALSGAGVSRGIVQLSLSSTNLSVSYNLQALILPKVTGQLPFHDIDYTRWSHIRNLKLADLTFHQPSDIDLLIGADICPELLQAGKLVGPRGSPIAQNTSLGWILSGCINPPTKAPPHTFHVSVNISDQLRQFWELEEIPLQRHLSDAERDCENHFKSTHTRDQTGRYVVRLPFSDNTCLGNSREIAKGRLLQVERKLAHQPEMRHQYVNFMAEYLSLGHMSPVSNEELVSPCVYHLPHHAVIKKESSTTKLRVVFDGTAKPVAGPSINDKLLVGPVIQDDLVTILLRFRMFNIAYTADINKMYRQILIHPDDRNYQRILWRNSPEGPIQEYNLNTVTYGTSAAPYLATRCLQQLAYDGEHEFPLASVTLLNDFYVDDLISGSDSLSDALEKQSQLIRLLNSGGFELRKWSSSEPALLESLPIELRENQSSIQLNTDGVVKTLGLYWQPVVDYFAFRVTVPLNSTSINKRTILSEISRLFDPLGWLAPVVLCAKLVIQKLWLLGVSWDESLPTDILKSWNQFKVELPMIEKIRIHRKVISNSNCKDYQLHGFSDASEQAYGAVIFLRSTNGDKIDVRLVCAKSKVAPVKQISLPRLELCGAVLLARLMKKVQGVLSIDVNYVYLWTDSMVVLSWLQGHASRWKTFVANRVSEIQELIPPQHWKHVKSADNPADCLSRGLTPSQLIEFPLWWYGPDWLRLEENLWPRITKTELSAPEELKRNVSTFTTIITDTSFISRYSSLTKLIRVTAYCRRFINNCKSSGTKENSAFLSTSELQQALVVWVIQTQSTEFADEINSCVKGEPLPCKSRLLSLYPFLDDEGLLRAGGRLQEANISYDRKHPIILPSHHPLTDLIIAHEHIANLHAGPQLLLASIRRRFWILCARQVIRHHIHKCVKCFRHRVNTSQQLMGNLPSSRLQPVRPFLRCGVDYAGPITLRFARGRGGTKSHKAYVCVFVCFVVKALHLELVNDLSTESFLAALHRFISRRGRPSDIYSDCGTNFVGANRELGELHKLVSSSNHNSTISHVLSAKGIEWHFNPPAAPHFGGLWEAGVKSVKFHLRRVVGNSMLTYEEMYTVLTQIEACLNSRPLCPLSSDPNDLSSLTPGHFLIGDALTSFPEPDYTQLSTNRLSRWQLVQHLFQTFWKRWSSEFLARLQQRPKWATSRKSIGVGDLILLKDDNLSPFRWPLARVVDVHPGKDGHVRVVTLKTISGQFKRPISKCCVLPIEQ